MPTIFELKELAAPDTPLLLFDCVLHDGTTECFSTHTVTVDSNIYSARVLRHNLFEMQAASDLGVDCIPRISITLANADSRFSERERAIGWKGARITVRFLFYDLQAGAPASESTVLFRGIANPPDEITESTFRISAINRMSMQRVLLPTVRIQRRCPWDFPRTSAEREEGADGGAGGKYSRFYRCGYSADLFNGTGALDGDQPFTTCGYTREQCDQRGMFTAGRFGGVEFLPPAILVRSYGEKGSHLSPVKENQTLYNDFVPLVYGTAWYTPPIVFARNDGNLTRMEVLLGMGELTGVLKVLVNDIDVPAGRSGTDMTGTGWYNIVSLGARSGTFNPDFSKGGRAMSLETAPRESPAFSAARTGNRAFAYGRETLRTVQIDLPSNSRTP